MSSKSIRFQTHTGECSAFFLHVHTNLLGRSLAPEVGVKAGGTGIILPRYGRDRVLRIANDLASGWTSVKAWMACANHCRAVSADEMSEAIRDACDAYTSLGRFERYGVPEDTAEDTAEDSLSRPLFLVKIYKSPGVGCMVIHQRRLVESGFAHFVHSTPRVLPNSVFRKWRIETNKRHVVMLLAAAGHFSPAASVERGSLRSARLASIKSPKPVAARPRISDVCRVPQTNLDSAGGNH